MKKLMFAMAAVSAGVAFAADDAIVSANIVGYAESGLRKNATMVTPQFLDVGKAIIALDALVAKGTEASDNVIIQELDEYGRLIDGKDYAWNDWACDTPCWVSNDGTYTKVEGVTFAAGQGLWTFGSCSDQQFQSSGEVGLEDVVVQLRKNATAAGNPFPVPVGLQDMVAEGTEASDNVIIQELDEYGRLIDGKDYAWNDWACDTPCWVSNDGTYTKVEGVTFAAGYGLWVFGSNSDQTLRFPAPEL